MTRFVYNTPHCVSTMFPSMIHDEFDFIEIARFQSCCSHYTALMNARTQWSHSRIATPLPLLIFAFYVLETLPPYRERHLEISQLNFHFRSHGIANFFTG